MKSENASPEISIVVPTHNRPHLVLRALDSIFAQTNQNFEVIVIDDKSVPALELSDRHRRSFVRLIRNEKNVGAAAARNIGISAARAPIVAFLDDDDELFPEFVEKMLEKLNPSAAAHFAWSSVCFADENKDGSVANAIRSRSFYGTPDASDLFRDALTIGTGFGLTVRTDCLKEIDMFDVDLEVTEDTDCILKLMAKGFLPTVVEPILVRIHNHSGDRMTKLANNPIRLAETRLLLDRYADFLAKRPECRLQLERHIDALNCKPRSGDKVYLSNGI